MQKASEQEISAVVEAAKMEAMELLRHGWVWEYDFLKALVGDADPISRVNRMVQELQARGNSVLNIPPAVAAPAVEEPAVPSTAGSSTASDPEPVTSSEGDLYQWPSVKVKMSTVRRNMEKKGLYKKHSLDHHLLKSFANYLENDLANENFKQEVENMARFMYFINPSKPSLEFVKKHEDTRKFFSELSGLSKQTHQNYLKSIKRFLKFHTGGTDLCFQDEELHRHCVNFIQFLSTVQAGFSKQVSRETTKKRFEILTRGCVTPRQCLAVLDAAKPDFLRIIGKVTGPEAIPGCDLSRQERQLMLYFLEAVLILKHQQRPGVVENMTVNEWVRRTRDAAYGGHVVVGVTKHKTAAVFALSQEEEMWFDLYYTEVRPAMLIGRQSDLSSEDKFFISSSGNSIYNCSNDLRHLHEKYNLPNITSQMARRAFETATKDMSDMADYLSHSMSTAERHYRMRESRNVIRARMLLRHIAGESDSSPDERAAQTSGSRFPKMDKVAAYDLFMRSFPVTIDGTCPGKSARTDLVGITHERPCYDRWRAEQKALRMQHVIEHFGRRLPKESKVHAWMEKQGWTVNHPDVQLLLKQWKPPGSVDTAMDCRVIRKLVRSQKWKGLTIVETEENGRSVKTRRKFVAGEVVCDYHGRQVTWQEGLRILSHTTEGQSGLVFFYQDTKGLAKCIDARDERCQCHPGRDTFGRLIGHSGKRANLRSRLYSLDDRDILLFLASRDIAVDEELQFDYGVKKRSFAGEGLDMDWI
ncbi:uncharacterized protein [Paramormyrops kingsleyae]|uniref:uncharacterized protein n=1 Tax=Paramormyrops kingsleyae TaxID=1676925 RepID=UPI003B96B0D0